MSREAQSSTSEPPNLSCWIWMIKSTEITFTYWWKALGCAQASDQTSRLQKNTLKKSTLNFKHLSPSLQGPAHSKQFSSWQSRAKLRMLQKNSRVLYLWRWWMSVPTLPLRPPVLRCFGMCKLVCERLFSNGETENPRHEFLHSVQAQPFLWAWEWRI